MDVLAFLPPPLATHLRAVLRGDPRARTPGDGDPRGQAGAPRATELSLLGPGSRAEPVAEVDRRGFEILGPYRLWMVDDWAATDAHLRSAPIDLVVIDPAEAGGWEELRAMGGLARRFRSLPVVVYTSLTPQALKGVVELARLGLSQLVLYRFDDSPARMRELFERSRGESLADALLVRLRTQLALLPPAMAAAVEQLVRTPQRFRTADDLVRESGVPRRSLYRAIEAAGLGTPSRLVKGAKLLQAYAYLRDAGYSLEDVARKCDFSSRQLFARHVRELSGLQPRVLRRDVAPAEFLELLARRLTAPDDEVVAEAEDDGRDAVQDEGPDDGPDDGRDDG